MKNKEFGKWIPRWIGVDLDRTLAVYDKWEGPYKIGKPVPLMVSRVKTWLAEGCDVRVFTARVNKLKDDERDMRKVRKTIELWCVRHIGRKLKITCKKDQGMWELWDDRAVQVENNTGRRIGRSQREELKEIKK